MFEKYIKIIDRFIKPLIWLSVGLTIIEIAPELGLGGEHSLDGAYCLWFLWAERVIASLFTLEFLFRLIRSGPKKYIYTSSKSPFVIFSPFAIIDIIAILPFWAGFFLPASVLNYVRMARIFRLLKFYRYSRSLQLNALAFYRAFNQLKGLAFQVLITSLFFTLLVFEAEHKAQPDAFGNLTKSTWFTVVTSTTVGYGDRSPITVVGMVIVGISLPLIIAQMGGAIGILNSAFDQVMEEERDPTIDPIKLFAEEHRKHQEMRQMDRDYEIDEDQ
jgi:voltage-gated potassium channel